MTCFELDEAVDSLEIVFNQLYAFFKRQFGLNIMNVGFRILQCIHTGISANYRSNLMILSIKMWNYFPVYINHFVYLNWKPNKKMITIQPQQFDDGSSRHFQRYLFFQMQLLSHNNFWVLLVLHAIICFVDIASNYKFCLKTLLL